MAAGGGMVTSRSWTVGAEDIDGGVRWTILTVDARGVCWSWDNDTGNPATDGPHGAHVVSIDAFLAGAVDTSATPDDVLTEVRAHILACRAAT